LPDKFVFADEAGCFTFNREPNVSRYFILCTITMDDCDVGADLLALRRQLAWDGHYELGEYFHATADKQKTRDAVFETIRGRPFQVQATIMEKAKALESIRESRPVFYKHGYYYHFKHGVLPRLRAASQLLVTTASLGTRKERYSFENSVSDVMRQTCGSREWKTDFMPSHADPCLQVADYCAWAIQRKWERKDMRSYQLIADKITYEYDLWRSGTSLYF
jgi:hypothetical protein